MAPRLDVDRFLEDTTGRYARVYSAAISDMLTAQVVGNLDAYRAARDRLGEVIRQTMGVAELLGMAATLQEAARFFAEPDPIALAARRSFGTTVTPAEFLIFADEPVQTLVPRVEFTEAIDDIVTRVPVTIRDAAERTAGRIAQVYTEGHNIAFARAAEATVTEKAQQVTADLLRSGAAEREAGRQLKIAVDRVREITDPWSESYSRMVFRTNVNTATTSGRFRTMGDPDVRRVLPAFEFESAGDVDVRHNHKLDARGAFIMQVDNPAWQTVAPPLGHNCRCQVRAVSVAELRRMGRLTPDGDVVQSRVPSGKGPDPGFRPGGTVIR